MGRPASHHDRRFLTGKTAAKPFLGDLGRPEFPLASLFFFV